MSTPTRPRILGLGGTTRVGSTSELALREALRVAADQGARAELITAAELLDLPMYDPEREGDSAAQRLLSAVRAADGLVIATPGYHGGISGLMKNALDHLQALMTDPEPYLHGKAVGCVVTAGGWQAGVSTLASLRATVHALRGWPTPLGVVVNSSTKPFGSDGAPVDSTVAGQLYTLGSQVTAFAGGREVLVS